MVSRLSTLPDTDTAESAAPDTALPTMPRSTAEYIICSAELSMWGTANVIIPRAIFPRV